MRVRRRLPLLLALAALALVAVLVLRALTAPFFPGGPVTGNWTLVVDEDVGADSLAAVFGTLCPTNDGDTVDLYPGSRLCRLRPEPGQSTKSPGGDFGVCEIPPGPERNLVLVRSYGARGGQNLYRADDPCFLPEPERFSGADCWYPGAGLVVDYQAARELLAVRSVLDDSPTLSLHSGYPLDIDASRDGRRLLVELYERVLVFDLVTGRRLLDEEQPRLARFPLLSSGGKRALLCSWPDELARIEVVDLDGEGDRRSFRVAMDPAAFKPRRGSWAAGGMDLDATGRVILMTSGRDLRACLLDARTGKLMSADGVSFVRSGPVSVLTERLEGGGGVFRGVFPGPTLGKPVRTHSKCREVDCARGRPLVAQNVTESPTWPWLYETLGVRSYRDGVLVIDVERSSIVLAEELDHPAEFGFSPSGTAFAVLENGGRLRVWRTD